MILSSSQFTRQSANVDICLSVFRTFELIRSVLKASLKGRLALLAESSWRNLGKLYAAKIGKVSLLAFATNLFFTEGTMAQAQSKAISACLNVVPMVRMGRMLTSSPAQTLESISSAVSSTTSTVSAGMWIAGGALSLYGAYRFATYLPTTGIYRWFFPSRMSLEELARKLEIMESSNQARFEKLQKASSVHHNTTRAYLGEEIGKLNLQMESSHKVLDAKLNSLKGLADNQSNFVQNHVLFSQNLYHRLTEFIGINQTHWAQLTRSGVRLDESSLVRLRELLSHIR